MQVRVVCRSDAPGFVQSQNDPRENTLSPTTRRAVRIFIALNRPFQMDDDQIFADETSFVIEVPPEAIPHLPGVKLPVMLEEFVLPLEPPPEYVDEIDLGHHQLGRRLGVVAVPGSRPGRDQILDRLGYVPHDNEVSWHEIRACRAPVKSLQCNFSDRGLSRAPEFHK